MRAPILLLVLLAHRLFPSLERGASAAGLLACLLLLAPPSGAQTRGVEILWDHYGVGHVYAQSLEGLFFGYGYLQMQSHGDLVLKLYGESRGRSAEYWGENETEPALFGSASSVENDRWVRINGAPARAEQWLQLQSTDYQRYFQAFADGMNTYAERHPERLESSRRKVLPIRAVDPLLHVHRVVHFGYLSPLRAVDSAVKSLRSTTPSTLNSGAGGESNAWAIAPSKSAQGTALLLMNPHLPWGDWSTYYEAHLVAPGVQLYGSSQIGFPMLRFVFSDFLGFTQTVNSLDASDFFRLKTSPDGLHYRFDGELRPFAIAREVIKILQKDGSFREETMVIKSSVHGPVVWEKDGLALAMRTAGLDRPFMIEQYWKMALARSFSDYEAELRRLQVPTFNITYADRDGHIMYLYNGTLPKRSIVPGGKLPEVLPGDTSATLWTEIHPYEDLPKVIDPPSGWIQNTNNPPWATTLPSLLQPESYPAGIPQGPLSLRTLGSLRMLHYAPQPLSFEDLLSYKHSTRLELADRILDDVIAAAKGASSPLVQEAVSVLSAWNRHTDSDSRGALLFESFAKEFMGNTYADWSGFAISPDWRQPLSTPRGVKDPERAVTLLEKAAIETRRKYGSLDAPWGAFRRFQIGKTNLPANGADGNLGAFRVMRYSPLTKDSPVQRAVFGDTFSAVVEFSNPVRAQVLTSYGNSSQPGSPHQEDQLFMLSQQRMRPALLQRHEIERHTVARDQF